MSPPITTRPTKYCYCSATGITFTGPTTGLRSDTDVGAAHAPATL